MHQAPDRISKLGRHAHFRRRIFARAFKVRCNCSRANKNEGRQHRKLLFQRVGKLMVAIGFGAGSASIVLGRGVRTAT
jgi:hypothetical protein